MNNKQISKCRYCDKPLDQSLHGNRNYCEPREGEPMKLSCKAQREKHKKKEREEFRKKETEIKTELRYCIEILLDNKSEVDLFPDQYEKYLDPYLDVFIPIILPENRGILYYFEEYSLFKKEVKNIVFFCLAKTLNYDK
jgi:hypothetical protein